MMSKSLNLNILINLQKRGRKFGHPALAEAKITKYPASYYLPNLILKSSQT